MLDIIYREKTNQQTANRYRFRYRMQRTVPGTIMWTTIAKSDRWGIEFEDDSIQLLVSLRFFSFINQTNKHTHAHSAPSERLYNVHICTYDYIIITLFSIEGYPKSVRVLYTHDQIIVIIIEYFFLL